MDVQGIPVKDPKIESDLLNVDPMCRYEDAYPVSLYLKSNCSKFFRAGYSCK